MSAVDETSVRDLLAQQRARGQGPALTEEEEELVLAELLRSRQPEDQSDRATIVTAPTPTPARPSTEKDKSDKEKTESRNDLPYASIVNRNNSTASVSTGFTGYTDWDGNPPSFDSHDWASTHTARAGGMVSSISGTSFRSDGTHMSPSESNHGHLPSSNSHSSMKHFHKERVQARSYGFTGSASFRDNNYLRQVQKAKANGSIDAKDSYANSFKSPRANGHALPDDISPNPSSNGSSMPKATSLSDMFSGFNTAPSPQAGSASLNGHESTSPFSAKSRELAANGERSPEHSKSPVSTMSDQPLPEMRTVPQSDDEGAPRDTPTGRSTQRQSVLMSMNPQQMKRVSLALLEIETHLGRQLTRSDEEQTEVNLNHNDEEREEILDGDDENDDDRDRVHSPVRGQQGLHGQQPVTDVQSLQSQPQPARVQTQQPQQPPQQSQPPAMLDRQNSTP